MSTQQLWHVLFVLDVVPARGGRRGRGQGRARGRGRGAVVPPVVNDNESKYEQVARLALIAIDTSFELAAQEESKCLACVTNKLQYMVAPCNHVVFCGPCTNIHRNGIVNRFNILESHVTCPHCRAKVVGYTKVFV